jgi:hypothetical protein
MPTDCKRVFTQLTHLDHPSTPTRTMEVSTQSLYPVVQDLTDAEYGEICCCDIEFGSFSLEDLVMPVISPLPISPPSQSRTKSLDLLRPPQSPLVSPSPSPPKQTKSHQRGSTLGRLKLRAATERSLFMGHRRSISSPSTIISEAEDFTTVAFEAEERVTDSVRFDEVYVLTRQVSTRHFWPLKMLLSRNVSHSFFLSTTYYYRYFDATCLRFGNVFIEKMARDIASR